MFRTWFLLFFYGRLFAALNYSSLAETPFPCTEFHMFCLVFRSRGSENAEDIFFCILRKTPKTCVVLRKQMNFFWKSVYFQWLVIYGGSVIQGGGGGGNHSHRVPFSDPPHPPNHNSLIQASNSGPGPAKLGKISKIESGRLKKLDRQRESPFQLGINPSSLNHHNSPTRPPKMPDMGQLGGSGPPLTKNSAWYF